VKWLPHAQHPAEQDGAGTVRLVADGIDGLDQLLAGELGGRGRFEAGATPTGMSRSWSSSSTASRCRRNPRWPAPVSGTRSCLR
jgi:hypothetical protein